MIKFRDQNLLSAGMGQLSPNFGGRCIADEDIVLSGYRYQHAHYSEGLPASPQITWARGSLVLNASGVGSNGLLSQRENGKEIPSHC